MMKYLPLIALLILAGCENKARECQDEETLNQAKLIIWQNVQKELKDKANLLDETTFKTNIIFEHPRPTNYDEKIKKYTCAGKVRYLALGIPEFGKTLEESGAKFTVLKKLRKEAVKSPLRYNALSILSDNPYLLSEFLQNSDANGYSFETEFNSQSVGEENYVSIGLAPAHLQAMYAAAALDERSSSDFGEDDPVVSAAPTSPEEAAYVLSGKEKGIIATALSNFKRDYGASGVQGVISEREKCYQAAAAIKDSTLTLQCIAYDHISAGIITGAEIANKFPSTPGFADSDVSIRALESIENSISDKLSTTKLRETFLKGIQKEADEQIAHEAKNL